MHEEVVYLYGMQQKRKDNTKALKVVHTTITVMWSMQYKGAPSELEKKKKATGRVEESTSSDDYQSKRQLGSFFANIQASYERL